MLKIGDKVRFLNEQGEGIIVAFRGKDLALVQIEDGFEIPTPVKELVPVHDENKPAQRIVQQEEARIVKPIGTETIVLCITPDGGPFSNTFGVSLVNNSTYKIVYTITQVLGQAYMGIACNVMDAVSFHPIEGYTKKDLQNTSQFIVQLLLFKEGAYHPYAPIEKHVVLKDNKLDQVHLLKDAPILGKGSFLFELVNFKDIQTLKASDYEESFNIKQLEEKYKIDNPKKPVGKAIEKSNIRMDPKNGHVEVDLHIEEIIDNVGGLTNGEIVQIQLKHCRKAIDIALQRNSAKMTIIHGVGNGTLKREVRDLLTTYEHFKYYDAPMEKFGYGATEVMLKG